MGQKGEKGKVRLTRPDFFLASVVKHQIADKFQRCEIHFDFEEFHSTAEIVVAPCGWYGDEQAQRGGDKGFANPFDGRGEADPSRRAATFEGIENADDRSEHADERSSTSDGCKTAQAAFHLEANFAVGAQHGALGQSGNFQFGQTRSGGRRIRPGWRRKVGPAEHRIKTPRAMDLFPQLGNKMR